MMRRAPAFADIDQALDKLVNAYVKAAISVMRREGADADEIACWASRAAARYERRRASLTLIVANWLVDTPGPSHDPAELLRPQA